MALINSNTLLVFGGLKGNLASPEFYYNDVFLFNINESIWVEPIIGGIQPTPRFGFSFISNYNVNKTEIMICGGSGPLKLEKERRNNPMKIYIITENGK